MPEIALSSSLVEPRVRFRWLWSARRDLLGNFVPFWLGFALLAGLFATRDSGSSSTHDAIWTFSSGGREWNVLATVMLLYGPLVDGPHLWATIARTYTDREEWAAKRKLLLGSLLAFALGPALILLPYGLHALGLLSADHLDAGSWVWTTAFGGYALFHIYKQHWGFVCLYRRKNQDQDQTETRLEAWLFPVLMWAPYFAMLLSPSNPEPLAGAASGLLFGAAHAAFLASFLGYAGYQLVRASRGETLNGSKLMYIATVSLLYYLTFAFHPRLAAFWVLATSTGHCVQYHAVVWSYGQKQYALKPDSKPGLPHRIFSRGWLYVALGLAFALLSLQGPGSGMARRVLASALDLYLFPYVFPFLDHKNALSLGMQIGGALVAGVRLHHFYVDSKIWRVSKQPAVARSLDVELASASLPPAAA
ncbi:MAG: putative rane protein [Myxococcaceae bacterium]|nr:putative rane protein [Myxococcaceae bacterium]